MQAIANHTEDSVIKSIQTLLDHVLSLTDRQMRLQRMFYRNKPGKNAWIWIPTSDRCLRAVHAWPNIPAYRQIHEKHRPAMWDAAKVADVDSKLVQAYGELRQRAFAKKLEVLRDELLTVASLAGYVYEVGGPRFFPEIGLAEVNDRYTKYLPQEPQVSKYHFRSAAGIRLEVGTKRLGVLMLYDTLRGGFLAADAATLEIFGGLISPLLAKAMSMGLYADQSRVYR